MTYVYSPVSMIVTFYLILVDYVNALDKIRQKLDRNEITIAL
ncbi:hypothetical protein QFZ28_002487 [Neobacillus niacini]|nr:hypothetical protein [Neobacillus niacini]MDQ1002087.1 hypothetical protein [Neobacillus niacini]